MFLDDEKKLSDKDIEWSKENIPESGAVTDRPTENNAETDAAPARKRRKKVAPSKKSNKYNSQIIQQSLVLKVPYSPQPCRLIFSDCSQPGKLRKERLYSQLIAQYLIIRDYRH